MHSPSHEPDFSHHLFFCLSAGQRLGTSHETDSLGLAPLKPRDRIKLELSRMRKSPFERATRTRTSKRQVGYKFWTYLIVVSPSSSKHCPSSTAPHTHTTSATDDKRICLQSNLSPNSSCRGRILARQELDEFNWATHKYCVSARTSFACPVSYLFNSFEPP